MSVSERRKRYTPERIVEIAVRKNEFTVSLNYRDDWLRDRCARLKHDGKFVGGRRVGRMLVYYPAAELRK